MKHAWSKMTNAFSYDVIILGIGSAVMNRQNLIGANKKFGSQVDHNIIVFLAALLYLLLSIAILLFDSFFPNLCLQFILRTRTSFPPLASPVSYNTLFGPWSSIHGHTG